ncbi:hypothetical protein C8R43DRAFT_29416 [Mycena crocata]|nr:hypothetical protein C8R43DRAFT_29416 [Mycena crocata]
MSIEQRRKQLMANQPQWGDVPSPRSASNGAREESPPLVATRGSAQGIAALKALDALIMKDPKDRVKRANADNNPTISFSCKGWTMESLLRLGKNFAEVPRVRWSPATSISEQISSHETTSPGMPLVVEGLHNNPRWIGEKFTPEWLERNGPKDISARNVHDRLDQRITLSAFITRSREISPFATPEEAERLYGKDVACPEEWENFLHDGEIIPASLSPNGPNNLIKNLPESDRPETLMCYLGVGDTFTPCHKDLCASSGHNLMCYTENGGSSFWFMTATSSANAAAEYFHDRLSHELDHETHVITVEQLARTPFKVYITEQKLGDLVLVPPRSCHQVVNAGGITIKTSWSRMTLDGLSLALRYELPLYRRVCRSEVYRVKSTIYHTLLQTIDTVSKLLRKQPARSTGSRNAVASTSQKDMPTQLRTLIRVLLLFDSILIEEYSQRSHNMRNLSSENEGDTDEIGQLTCDFCGGDVFQSFFECRTCVDGPRRAAPGGGLIVCPGCYVEGRTCGCETMVPMQCRSFDELLNARARAVELFNACSELQHQAIIHIVPSKEELLADDKIGLFRAALVLRKRRLDLAKLKEKKDGPRRCTVARDRELNHESSWILKCDKCHSAMCFAHMVWERQLHSAEAFLAHEKDKNQVTFHKVHMETKKRFNAELAALKLEELDKLPPTGVQLAYLAATFSTCKPVHPNQKLRKAGYYDLTVWENDFPDDNIADHMPAESQRPSSSKGSSARSKRMVMDCILLTPRPQKRKERAVERKAV